MRVLFTAGRKSDLPLPAGSEPKKAATLAMSSLPSCAAMAFMIGFLREPSFSALSCASR